MVVEDARVVGHAVLVRVEGLRARCDVCCRHHVQEVLVCDESCVILEQKITSRQVSYVRSCVSSNELSRGCVMSGK